MTISKAVEIHISQQPFLQEAIIDGIINYLGLARKIKVNIEHRVGFPVKEGSIVMALKRMSPSYYYPVNAGIKNFIQKLGNLTVRSNINDYTFKHSYSLIRHQKTLLESVQQNRDIFFSYAQGTNESTLIISAASHELVMRIFKDEILLSQKSNLASLSILLPKENTEISGIYYYIFKNLAWEDINIVEVISTTNEFTILVDEKDIDRSFSILRRMKQKASE
jgi:hypothetical protein